MEDAVDALCKFSIMYRQDGFVKMHSPFRLYFQDPRGVANSGPQLREQPPGRLGDGTMAEPLASTSVAKKLRAGVQTVKKLFDFLHISGPDQLNHTQDGAANAHPGRDSGSGAK